MMTRTELVELLLMEYHQRIPEPAAFDDSPATCARRRAVLEEATAGFVYTTAEKRQAVKVRRHLQSVKGDAA